MGKISVELFDMLRDFLVSKPAGKALDGITYNLLLKNERDRENYEKFMEIKKEALRCGFNNNEVFRVYELSNGYIFDMDLSVAKAITYELSKQVARQDRNEKIAGDLIGDYPEQRRREDMILLSKFLKSRFNRGERRVEVALYSQNTVPRITINAKNEKGEPIALKYNAYAIRHWDIEELNARLMIPDGIRISKIEPCEVMPSKTGVRFIIHMISL